MLELFQTFALPVLAIMIVSYLLGSISFSIIFTKMFSKEDIRTMGSGNAGTTNVLRSVGKRAAILTFVFDILKCVISVLLAKYILEYICAASNAPFYIVNYGIYLAGFCCSIGHMYPIFFKFKGGKGVVTVATMAALADWRVFLAVIGLFIVVFAIWRMVSLGSVIAAGTYPIATFFVTFFTDYNHGGIVSLKYVLIVTAITALMGGIVIFKHRGNIVRIMNGTEKKLFGNKEKV